MHKMYTSVKNNFKKLALIAFASLAGFNISIAQVAGFENLMLEPESSWDGSDHTGGFESDDAYFFNTYDTTYKYWSGGFSYSNKTDVTTAGYTNPFSSFAGRGVFESPNYATAYGTSSIVLKGALKGGPLNAVAITNSTYAALSMKNGDAFGKKFGGLSGNDPDWFKLIIKGYLDGVKKQDSIEFYLADFRSSNNENDFILDNWKWVNLGILGNVDSLVFSLSSSDVGDFGMNTPAYFSIDDFNGFPEGINDLTIIENGVKAYPNPATDQIKISSDLPGEIKITDFLGNIVYDSDKIDGLITISVSNLKNGIYIISSSTRKGVSYSKFVKQ